MQEDYQLLGMSKKQFNRMRKLCVSELLLRKIATALEIHAAIKEQTGSWSQNVGDTIRAFYLKTRKKRNSEARSSQRWDYRPYTKPPKRRFQPIGQAHPDYKRDDGFYKSREWRELRIQVLDLCRYCQACGARPPQVQLHVDHVIPRYKAPHLSLSISNLQVMCEDCNVGKGAWSMADFRDHFRSI
jgi:5-methylcytosine-specific restriction endonuclease McrA